MKQRSERKGRYRQVLPVLSLLLFAALLPASAAEGNALEDRATAAEAQQPHRRNGLEMRIRKMTKWLDLDAKQQAELRRVLEGQRDDIQRVWNDTSVPAAYRVSATQAITDRTADQIRALLNDEQRKKYNPPKLRQPDAAGGEDVERWMGTSKPR